MTVWWLSFVGGQPERCLGVVLTEAPSFPQAVSRANELGLNPGGQVAGFVVPFGEKEHDPAHRDRLISPEELRTLFQAKPLREWEEN